MCIRDSLSKIYRTSLEKSIENRSNIDRKYIEHLSNIYRKPIEHRTNIDRHAIESLSKVYRTSIEHLSKVYRKSIEHLSNSYRNLPMDYRATRPTYPSNEKLSDTNRPQSINDRLSIGTDEQLSNLHPNICHTSAEHISTTNRRLLEIHPKTIGQLSNLYRT